MSAYDKTLTDLERRVYEVQGVVGTISAVIEGLEGRDEAPLIHVRYALDTAIKLLNEIAGAIESYKPAAQPMN